jgi:hypothetical protein
MVRDLAAQEGGLHLVGMPWRAELQQKDPN